LPCRPRLSGSNAVAVGCGVAVVGGWVTVVVVVVVVVAPEWPV
jgi:hypothetical protein